jgi:hypothetical protein
MRSAQLLAASIFSFFVFAVPALTQNVGSVVEATPAAELQRGSGRVEVVQRMQLQLGDIITTGSSGRVQILFEDDTKIAVGANSRLVIEDILFDSDRTASRFSVRAIGGAFRFLSGNSRSEAYTVNTPLATLGIRGTTFDFSVTAGRGVDLATFDGEVSLCYLNGGCAFVSGRCTLLSAPVDGDRFAQPESPSEKRALLERHFPFVVEQRGLRRDFRAPVRACGLSRLPGDRASGPAPQPTPGAPSAPGPSPSRTGGAQAGGGASTSGGGGSTAAGTTAGAGGPTDPTGDADASSGGVSAGGSGGASAGGGGASAGGQ